MFEILYRRVRRGGYLIGLIYSMVDDVAEYMRVGDVEREDKYVATKCWYLNKGDAYQFGVIREIAKFTDKYVYKNSKIVVIKVFVRFWRREN